MKNKKGQALVEFVVIMPIFIMLLISIIDLGNIIYKKYHLENDLDYIVDLYRLNKISEITKLNDAAIKNLVFAGRENQSSYNFLKPFIFLF